MKTIQDQIKQLENETIKAYIALRLKKMLSTNEYSDIVYRNAQKIKQLEAQLN